jgi:ABC-type molybdate transport system substrate-binding protein
MSDRFSACLNSFAHLNGFKHAILNAKSIGHSNAGTEYLGPLPPDLIEYGRFGVAFRNVSKNQNEARALITFMTSPEAAPLLRKTAMEPPAR